MAYHQFFMKISKSALDKILSLFVPTNRAQILYKTMKKPTVMLLFSGSCCGRVVICDDRSNSLSATILKKNKSKKQKTKNKKPKTKNQKPKTKKQKYNKTKKQKTKKTKKRKK